MFNVGDRVKVVEAGEDFFKGLTATVVDVLEDEEVPYDIEFDAGLIPDEMLQFVKLLTGSTYYPACESDLELV